MAKTRKSLDVPSETDWRIENDLRTLLDAECIQKDPKRLAAAQQLAKTKLMPLAAIASEGEGKKS